MKTIKIIDILNKISKGEEVPNKIKIRGIVFRFTEICTKNLTFAIEGTNINYAYENDYENYWLDCARINEEVEIIEKDKKIEKLERVNGSDLVALQKNSSLAEQNKSISKLIMYLNKDIEKINELIDIVKDLKKEGK